MQSARELFAALGPELARWRAEGTVSAFYFVRKPPDLRLRFRFRAPGASSASVEAWLDSLAGARRITRWAPSVYEPETHLFGGPPMLPLVHAHFDDDSMGWIEWIRIGERATISAAVLSLAVVNDLFFRVLDGPEEVWDAWCNLAALHRVSPSDPDSTPVRIIGVEDLAGRVSPPERRVLGRYARANRALAMGMRRLCARGELRYGRRSVLPFIALFHWNRYGLSSQERGSLLGAMTSALDPRRRLRGRDPEPRADAGSDPV